MRGQSSIEFVLILGVVLFFFTVILISVQMAIGDKTEERRNEILYDSVRGLQQEVTFAEETGDGYERVFLLPQKILNVDYEISINDGFAYGSTIDGLHALSLPVGNVSGQPNKGLNTIRKRDGLVYLN